jgi:hypothetical protein
MSTDSASVYRAKSTFLASQIHILSKLSPLSDWRENLETTEEGDLPRSVLDQVHYKLSVVVRKHQSTVYSTQAVRHVAEQIDALYREAVEGFEGEMGADRRVLCRGVDLTDKKYECHLPPTQSLYPHSPIFSLFLYYIFCQCAKDGCRNIDALPEVYPLEDDGQDQDELERYTELRARLMHSADLLAAQEQKSAYYKRMRQLMSGLEEPVENIQPQLVVRDCEMEEQLSKMKTRAAVLATEIKRVKLWKRGDSTGGGEETAPLDEMLAGFLES